MSLHPFLGLLGFNKPADFDTVERRFLDVVRARMQKPIGSSNAESAAQEEVWLRDIYHRYFAFSLEWVLEESVKHKAAPSAEAQKLRKTGRELLTQMHKGMIDFACCDLYIDHCTAQIRAQVREEEARLGVAGKDAMKWTPDAAAMLPKMMGQKKQTLDTAHRWKEALPLLGVLDRELQNLRTTLEKALATEKTGAEKVEAVMRSYTAALRMKDFEKARKSLGDIIEIGQKIGQGEALQKSGENIIALCEQKQDIFVSEEKRLYLKPNEVEQAYAALMKEAERLKANMAKYYVPYMHNKIDAMKGHKDKLQLIGQLEGQFILYHRLLIGLAKPLADMKDVRSYESDVLEKIKYLVNYKFPDIAVIRTRTEETLTEFIMGSKEFREIEEFDTEQLQEIDQEENLKQGAL